VVVPITEVLVVLVSSAISVISMFSVSRLTPI
jgi:hypothetical protein